MKKNLLKLLAALLCLSILTVVAVGCGNGNKKTTDDSSASSSAGAEENGIWLPFIEN